MPNSALIGQPPKTNDDYAIIVSLAHLSGIPDGFFDPSKGFPMPLLRPTSDHYPVSYPSHARETIAAISVAIFLLSLITGLRLGLRFFRRDLHWGWDDIVIIPAALAGIAWLSLVIGMASYGGLGKHFYDVTYLELYWFYKFAGIAQFIFWITVALVKISITLFNRRLTGLTSARWMIGHNVFLGLLVSYLLISVFLNAFTCTHPAGVQYDLIRYGMLGTKPKCLNPNAIGIALSVMHITFDFALLSVPLIILSKIKMSTAKKLRVGFLFSVGSIACVGSVMRQIRQYHQPADITWTMEIINWTLVDIFFATTAASLPVLNALIPKRWRTDAPSLSFLSSWSRGRRSGQHRASMRLGSHETVNHALPLPYGAPEPKCYDEGIPDAATPGASKYLATAPDGTAVLPEVRRSSSLEEDGDIESYANGTRWEDPTVAVGRPVPTYREKLSPDGLHLK